jgi:hypothetical protein
MMFLLRTALWTSVALALLPSFVPGKSTMVPVEVGATGAVTAASATMADLVGLCDRQPEACAAGAQLATAFRQRAQAGARIVYDFVGKELTAADRGRAMSGVAGADGTATDLASDAAKPTSETAASQQTLTAADLAPAWRGPPPRWEIAKHQS